MSDRLIEHFIHADASGHSRLDIQIEGMHCPSCVAVIEGALNKQPEIASARLNLSTRRLAVRWKGEDRLGRKWVELIEKMGYRAMPFDPETQESQEQKEQHSLLRCLAVAGFASGNLMLFSIPLWSSDAVEMGEATRGFFHWIQAAICLPAIAYCGRPFYRSAWGVLKEGHTNMDVPISVAVILAVLMSLFEAATQGAHAYFDSAVMLLFFLLIGRYLEVMARGRARRAAGDLLQMMKGSATLVHADGTTRILPLGELRAGMHLLVAAGERIGADGEVVQGTSDLDTSLITGESLPRLMTVGDSLFAGMLNLSAPLTMRVTQPQERSLMAEIVRLMEVAEQSQARYVTLADRLAGWYTPVVHLLAALTFAGWFAVGGIDWQTALLHAATVLIITCPCALGLAVPVVQVLASGRLLREGILLKSGSALERLAGITGVVFDKTGTLTLGRPVVQTLSPEAKAALPLAASLAVQSKHPLAKAVAAAYSGRLMPLAVEEVPGMGLQSVHEGRLIRLGRRSWCTHMPDGEGREQELWLAVEGEAPVPFRFADQLRPDAEKVVERLRKGALFTCLLSGDRMEACRPLAAQLHLDDCAAGLTPVEKTAFVKAALDQGAKWLMVGDGLNDAPSLAVATVSMSPASAMDITQNTADIVFQGDSLRPVLTAWQVARFSQKLVKENFWLASLYNVVAIPLAVAGYVTPMIAAIAMSSSSLVVIANAMRLNAKERE